MKKTTNFEAKIIGTIEVTEQLRHSTPHRKRLHEKHPRIVKVDEAELKEIDDEFKTKQLIAIATPEAVYIPKQIR